LTGPNGAGKTAILEALSYLAPGRGLRRARLGDIARRGAAAGWAVAARIERPGGGIVDVGTGTANAVDADGDGGATERRAVRIAGSAARGPAALAEVLSIVWLTPRMDRLFIDAASGRRRFLDRLVYGFDAAHARRVTAYDRALRERGRLLQDGGARDSWLSALEETMAELGVAVAAERRDTLARIEGALRRGVGPFPAATLRLVGTVEGWLNEMPAVEVEAAFRAELREMRVRDAATGGAGIGPHRGDLAVRHLANDLPADQCSTGEQKALLIAIVLADVRIKAVREGGAPLILLDEVVAHLDGERREALFAEIVALKGQAWLTGTEASLFGGLVGHAEFLDVADGRVRGAGSGR
jgi:DNA replication and repair protein RecF